MTNQQAEEKRQQLIDRVIYNIKKDIENGDIEKLKTLNDSKILLQIHSESIENELEEFRKRTGQKRATLSRINFLKDAINKNGITLETN
jgi:hypothetical protein